MISFKREGKEEFQSFPSKKKYEKRGEFRERFWSSFPLTSLRLGGRVSVGRGAVKIKDGTVTWKNVRGLLSPDGQRSSPLRLHLSMSQGRGWPYGESSPKQSSISDVRLASLTGWEVEKKKGFVKIHRTGGTTSNTISIWRCNRHRRFCSSSHRAAVTASMSEDGRGKMSKYSLEGKVIQKKILCGSHLGHYRSKNLLHPVHFVKRRGEMQTSIAGIRGDLFIFRPLYSQKYIYQTLLFLLQLLEKGGKVVVVDTENRSLSLLSWSRPAVLSSQEQEKLVYNEIRKGVRWPPPANEGAETSKDVTARKMLPKGLAVQLERDSNFAWSGEKWFGGALTNWEEISKKIYQFGTLLKEIPSDILSLSSRFEKWMKGFPGFLSVHLPLWKMEGLDGHPYISDVRLASLTRGLRSPDPHPYILDVRPARGLLKQPPGRSNIKGTIKGAWKLTKKGGIPKEIRLRLGKKVDGILLINPNENRAVIAEARLQKIPVIGFADSSTDLSGVDLCIPINLSSIGETFIFLSILFEIGGRLSGGSKGGRGFSALTTKMSSSKGLK